MYKFIVLHLQVLLVLFLLHLSLLNHAFDLLLMLINKQPQTCYCYYFLPAYHQVPCLQLAWCVASSTDSIYCENYNSIYSLFKFLLFVSKVRQTDFFPQFADFTFSHSSLFILSPLSRRQLALLIKKPSLLYRIGSSDLLCRWHIKW